MIRQKSAYACTCVGKDRQTTENELGIADMVVVGKIIGVANYADTTAAFKRPGSDQLSYTIWPYKIYKLAVEKKYKSPIDMPDTISIISGTDSGSCGYVFEIGKEYIVYGNSWKQKSIIVRQGKGKVKKTITETGSNNTFYTDICQLTQEANRKELSKLKSLTE